jgi:hypothetical protein
MHPFKRVTKALTSPPQHAVAMAQRAGIKQAA